ncbi:MAG: GNAT family N-acetyltransferase, partial [Dehalococcoidia bacterium]
MTDLELLEIEAGMSLDVRGRIARLRGVTFAVSTEGQACWLGAHVPDELAGELTGILAGSHGSADPARPPPALDACQRAIEAALGASTARHAGPSYTFPEDARFSSRSGIVRSDASRGEGLRDANPGNWGAIEWRELLDGQLGPWTMVVSAGEVLSICHTPQPMTDRAAECGVWTRPDARGRGYAADTAAAWAAMLAPTGRHLFYHHDADNVSSRRVAQRLGLRPIGWMWRVAVDEPSAAMHPLSSQGERHDAG